MKLARRVSTLLLTIFFSLVVVPVVFAHPLGNFTINHYAGLTISRETVSVDFVLDMAEIPAFQEIATFDANSNSKPDPAETTGYAAAQCDALRSQLDLRLDGKSATLRVASSSVEFPSGAGGLPTLRLSCLYTAPVTSQIEQVAFRDQSYSERLGWHEIVVNGEGVKVNSDFSTTSVSQRLTVYPTDMLSSPLDQREVEFNLNGGTGTVSNQDSQPESVTGPASREDAFTKLITLENLTFSSILLALGISFVWGAMHALTPGHGKTIVGAYLVGSRGTIKHAVYLGLTTTITHTLGVFLLGLITLFAARYIVPEALYPWMTLLSGLSVVAIGASLFIQRFRASGLRSEIAKLSPIHSKLQPALVHSTGMQVSGAPKHRNVLTQRSLVATTHAHSHNHNHAYHGHQHGHGPDQHSHLPPEEISWRNLLALGISGGLIPCPSALVVMLGAIALNRIGFGFVLVLVFSLGLAGALTAIGILFISAGKLFARFPTQGKILQWVPIGSALIVSVIGLTLCFRALTELGWY